MADLAGSYTLPGNPPLTYKIIYASTFTPFPGYILTNTNVKIIIQAQPKGNFGYIIQARATVGGVAGSLITVKEAKDRAWTADITADLGNITNQIPLGTKSLPAAVDIYTGSGSNGTTGVQTVTPNVYWTEDKFCSAAPAGIIPEDATTLTAEWGGAADLLGGAVYYKTELWVNNILRDYAGQSQNGLPITSGTADIAVYREGATFYFRTYACNANHLGDFVFGVQSETVTKNKMTPAAISTNASIDFDTPSFLLTRTNALNTNGDTSFTYTLCSLQAKIYNNDISSLGNAVEVAIYRSGDEPAGPYIKLSDLQALYAANAFKGTLGIYLESQNAYGTSKAAGPCYVAVNLQKAPEAPANITATGYFTIEGQPYYVWNQRGITFTWDPSVDPNGATPVYYDIQASVDGGSWVTKMTCMTDTTYTMPPVSLTAQGTLQFQVMARTKYGTTSSWRTSELLTTHYYHPPKMSGLSVDREDTSQITTGTVKKNTSISGITYPLVIEFKKGAAVLETQDYSMGDDPFDFSYTQSSMKSTDTFMETITLSDDISTVIFNFASPQSALTQLVPQYSALLTIREKGIGINAIAGDFANLIAKGTMSFYGAQNNDTSDGSIYFGTQKASGVNFYSGAYMDANGDLRAAEDIEPCHYIYQIQTYSLSTSMPVPPLRYRGMYANEEVLKDNIFVPTGTTPWKNFMDEDGNGGNYLGNGVMNGLWRKRDCGYYTSTLNPTGMLLIPISTDQTAVEYGEIELTLMWMSNTAYSQKIYAGWSTSGATNYVNGAYLTNLPSFTTRLLWESAASTKYIAIGEPGTVWTNLRMVNFDLCCSNTAAYKPANMRPKLSTQAVSTYTALATGTLAKA